MQDTTKLRGWQTMTEDIRRAMGVDYAEPDLDDIAAALSAGNQSIEIGGFFTVSGRPDIVDIPADIAADMVK